MPFLKGAIVFVIWFSNLVRIIDHMLNASCSCIRISILSIYLTGGHSMLSDCLLHFGSACHLILIQPQALTAIQLYQMDYLERISLLYI